MVTFGSFGDTGSGFCAKALARDNSAIPATTIRNVNRRQRNRAGVFIAPDLGLCFLEATSSEREPTLQEAHPVGFCARRTGKQAPFSTFLPKLRNWPSHS